MGQSVRAVWTVLETASHNRLELLSQWRHRKFPRGPRISRIFRKNCEQTKKNGQFGRFSSSSDLAVNVQPWLCFLRLHTRSANFNYLRRLVRSNLHGCMFTFTGLLHFQNGVWRQTSFLKTFDDAFALTHHQVLGRLIRQLICITCVLSRKRVDNSLFGIEQFSSACCEIK